jgi:hypothetical protein
MASRSQLGRALAALVEPESREKLLHLSLEDQETLAAYAWLERTPQGEIILNDLAAGLTKPCVDLYAEGERRAVLKIFAAIANGIVLAQGGQGDG